ncbi:MAG: amidohydrolase, partial [Gemmatimonadaceae bacterium]|nr:amidohydrolase [Gemmatimonadaceae bacterium]
MAIITPRGAVVAPESALSRFTDGDITTLVALRRQLHRHPELSWKEYATSDRLAEVVESLGLTVRRVANTGVVARVPGRDPTAPVVAVRGDIDALPIQEETGLEFSSAVPGIMHACGHDVHAAWAIGAAMSLIREPARGDVLVVLQPAEELGAGATAILASGALDGVKAIFGGHVDRRFDQGQVIAQA